MEETKLSSITRNLFNPSFLRSFRDPLVTSDAVVYLFTSHDEPPEKIPLKNLYPFMTVQDIKTYIYDLKQDEAFHPAFQALLVPFTESPSEELVDEYIPLDFAFVNEDKKKKDLTTISLTNPFFRIQEGNVDDRFVTTNGDPKNVKLADRSANTLEDIFSELFGTSPVVLHLFLYSTLVENKEDTLKIPMNWNGRIRPYFPDLPKNYETVLEDPKEKRFLNAKVTFVKNTLQLMDQLNDLIDGETRAVPLAAMKMISIKYLRLLWKKPGAALEDNDTESLFYKIPVTPKIPFLRILPTQTAPITKIYVESALRIPTFDPRLIPQWADIKGPSKEDFLFGKVMIREKEGNEPSLFGTLRIFEDQSADFLLQPPKNLKKFLVKDIVQFPDYLQESIERTYLEDMELDLKDAAVVCQISTIGLRQVSQSTFLKRLQAFSPLFIEIPPLPNENPLAMLRYRAVSRFTAEDKIFTFLTLYNSRKVLRQELGDNYEQDLIYAVMDTFKIRYADAVQIYAKWIEERGQQAVNNPESNDFGPQYNKGVDIAVFAQQSSYSFHLYRVDSMIHLQRILTALSLLLSGDTDDFQIDDEVAADLKDAASVVDEEQKEGEVEGEVNASEYLNNAQSLDGEEFGEVIGEEEEEVADEEEVSVASVQAKTAKPVETAKPKVTEIQTQAKPIREYFTKRLYDADPALFPPSEDLGRGKSKETVAKKSAKKESDKKQGYSVKCQSTDDRQPIVLSEEQYDAMLEEYKEDDVTFLEFPLRDNVPPKATGQIVYVLRYGASSLKMNYYVCCEYFCLRDFMMILADDFKGTKLRHPEDHGGREEKEPNTCPFCEGKLIVNKKAPGPNEWVYRRKENKPNKYPKLLEHTVHPLGIFQPCCFGRPPKYRITDSEFSHLSYGQVTEDKEEETEKTAASTDRVPLNYALTIYQAHKKYIVEKKKLPLEVGDKGGPQIGLLPSLLDSNFQQEDKQIVHTPQQKQELKPDSQAFLRIGVDNRQVARNESFFSAVAPYLIKANTADDLRNELLTRIHPRNFLFFNYGNLVLEFYNPSDASPMDTELRLWSQKNLEVDLAPENKDAVLRLWKSFHRFLDFLKDKTAFKEYRQFAQMLAMPNFLTPRGIVFIVLDIVKDGEDEKLEVRCPPFGYDNEQYSDADIGFLLHHHTGIWEPIFYSENERAHKQFGDRHHVVLKFQRALFTTWPSIVQKRVAEFTQKCSGPGRAAWTSGSMIDPYALIPVSRLVQGMAQAPEGVIRDAYNHIVGLTFRVEAGKPRLVAVPVVDDGTILTPARLHFDWDDYPAASLASVINFYRENVEPFFSYYPGYSTQYAVREEGTGNIVAVQLKNGIYIPSRVITRTNVGEAKSLEGLQLVEVTEMEWAINRDILFGKRPGLDDKPPLQTQERNINEAFEYLRLTFSRWFSSEEVSSGLRKQVEDIIFNPLLPLFERRKRLNILLGATILEWMDSEEEFRDEQKSLLRVDCRLQQESKCSGQCVWKPSTAKCMIHVPQDETSVVHIPEILMRRLIEELLRFPERRRQLLEKQVSPLVPLKDPILIRHQYIIPQASIAWQDMLRTDLIGSVKEVKKFYEEMSGDAKPRAPVVVEGEEGVIPTNLGNLLGEDKEIQGLYLYRPKLGESKSTMQPFLVSLGVFESNIGLEEDAKALTADSMRELTLLTRRPIMQVDIRENNINLLSFAPAKRMKDPTPLILVAMDNDRGGPAMISLSPTSPIPVPINRLPSGLKSLYEDEDMRVLVSDPGKK